MSSKFPFSVRSCGYNILKPCKGNNAAFEFGNIIFYHLASHLFCSDLKWICKLNVLFIINILTSNLFHNIRHVREFYKIQCFYWIVSTNILKHHRTASELIINYSMYFICYIWYSVWLYSPHRSTAENAVLTFWTAAEMIQNLLWLPDKLWIHNTSIWRGTGFLGSGMPRDPFTAESLIAHVEAIHVEPQ